MSNFFNLLKTFIKTTELTSAEKKRSKHFYTIMGTEDHFGTDELEEPL